MRTLVSFLVLFVGCVFLFFAPHHQRKADSMRACTLAEIYREFFSDMPAITSPRLVLLLFLGCAGIVTAFYPALLVLLIRQLPASSSWLIPGGLIAAAGVFANFIAMIISHTTFGFGGGNSTREETIFFWCIPILQLIFAATSIALGFSTTWASSVHLWLMA